MEEEGAEHVDHSQLLAARGRHDGGSPSGSVARGVRGPDHAIGRFEVRADLAAAESVVSERDRVDAHSEDLVREARCDADAVGGVLAVHDAGVDLELGAQAGEAPLRAHLRPGAPTTSAMKRMRKVQELYGTPSVADGKTWIETLLPAFGRVSLEQPVARSG